MRQLQVLFTCMHGYVGNCPKGCPFICGRCGVAGGITKLPGTEIWFCWSCVKMGCPKPKIVL